MSEKGYIQSNNNIDVIISSRVRIARNFADIPFPSMMNVEQSKKVLEKTKKAILNTPIGKDFKYINMSELDYFDKYILIEKHLISPQMVQNQLTRGVLISSNEKISIMINEEDHIRIQCILNGEALEKCLEEANNFDTLIEETEKYAYSERYGYLTSCPTNVGTGLRASCMVHLPALVLTKQINSLINSLGKLSVAVRGIYGEGTEAMGNIFQISNQTTLGITENESILNLKNIVKQVVLQERQIRGKILNTNRIGFEDKIFRSLGILSNARVISTSEAVNLLSDVRHGVALNILNNISLEGVDKLITLVQPANILKTYGSNLSDEERDIKRAELIRERVK
jgi:protein arginine kinase